jgi:hypothetical protein
MELSLPAGDYHLVLEVPHALSERLGAWLSLASLLVVLILAIKGAPFLYIAPTGSDPELGATSKAAGNKPFASAMHLVARPSFGGRWGSIKPIGFAVRAALAVNLVHDV